MMRLQDIIKNHDTLIEWLKTINGFKDIPLKELTWLVKKSEIRSIPAETYLYKKGEFINGTFIVLKGKLRLCVDTGMGTQEVDIFGSRDITGLLPFSRGVYHAGNGDSLNDLTFLFLSAEHMKELVRSNVGLTTALVHVMIDRVRYFSIFNQQNEKMLALGKLSAGLAHELNNPAAAIMRCAHSLHYQLPPESQRPLYKFLDPITAEYVNYANNILAVALSKGKGRKLSLSQRIKLEDSMLKVLSQCELEGNEDLIDNLIDAGFNEADLSDLIGHIPEKEFLIILNYLNDISRVHNNVGDIDSSAARISDLVASVKSYTHMDQGLVKQSIDIQSGLMTTVKLLEYKVRELGVKIEFSFENDTSLIQGLAGELNQLWTNLIDNGLDAMEGQSNGLLKIKTVSAGGYVQVDISDNGSGIPKAILDRIFDPFYTTKAVGKGVGLGLDIAKRIIRQHHGMIRVSSQPGKTIFTVLLPVH